MKKYIVFIGSYGFERNETLKEIRKNYKIVVVGEKNLYNADIFINENLKNEKIIVNHVIKLATKVNIVAVISFVEDGLILAYKISSLLNLKRNTYKAAFLSKDKYLTRLIMSKENNIRIPKFDLINIFNLKNEFLKFDVKKVVIKPIDGSGSKNVYKVDENNVYEIDKFLKHKFLNNNTTFLMEEFIESDYEISVEVLVNDYEYTILGVHKKESTQTHPFLEEVFILDHPITKSIYGDIQFQVDQIIKTMNFKNGGMHIEFLVKEEKVYLIEVNGRIGGVFVAEMIHQKYGVNIIEGVIKVFLSEKPNVKKRESNFFYGTRVIFAPKEGKINKIRELNKKNPIMIKRRLKEGDEIKNIASDYVAFIMKKNENIKELEKDLKGNEFIIEMD